MGVHGLWKLIDSAGKPIPIETLENKVLAVDVSIWLYQLVKGFRERAERSVNNPFLLGLFHRILKLLFYRIKPVFVFDGGVPLLKRKTIAARQRNRSKANEISENLKRTLLENLAKQHVLGKTLGEADLQIPKMLQPKPDMFYLPPIPEKAVESDEESVSSDDSYQNKYRTMDLHSIDITSEDFLSLPADMRHDILSELKEKRKQNSWAKVHLMPENSTDFSDFQMGRLLKRRAVQVGLEKAESEMGTRGFTIADIQEILKGHGIEVGQRIAADNKTRFLYATNEGDKTVNINDLRDIPSKKIKTSFHSELVDSIESDDEMSVALEEFDVDEPFLKISNDGLSQKEIFDLIKEGNPSAKSFSTYTDTDINKPSTSKLPELLNKASTSKLPELLNKASTSKIPEIIVTEYNLDSSKADTKCKDEEMAVQELVNDENLEHENNFSEDNEKLKLDHEILPRLDTRAQSDKSDTLLSNNHHVKMKSSTKSNKLPESTVSPENVITDAVVDNSSFKSEDKNNASPLVEDEIVNEITSEDNPNLSKNEIIKKAKEKDPSSIKPLSGDFSADLSQSDSDDDFMEVNESSEDNLNETSSLIETAAPQLGSTSALEILVKPDEINDNAEDIFADIFDSKNSAKQISKVSESIKISVDNKCVPRGESGTPNLNIESTDSKDLCVIKSEENADNVEPNKATEITVLKPDDNVLKEIKTEGSSEGSSSSTKIPPKNIDNEKTDNNYFKTKQLSLEEIISMKSNLEKESAVLMEETNREERLAATISQQITIEAQELLRILGLPYIVAPMEAEAQCAYLDITGQTQGTITDDSDIWLFGANNVYKNFFDQKKFVKQFKASDIQRVYHLSREDLIMIAMLTGSDYTTGLPGIGPVNALEITAQFAPRDDSIMPDERLKRFVRAYLAKNIDEKLAKKLQDLKFCEGFPSSEVVSAYLKPAIDDSKEAFSWGSPNLERLRQYAHDKFGWDRAQADKVIVPVINKLKENKIQRTMHNYFDWAFDGVENKMSRRVEKAVNILGGKISPQKPLISVRNPQKPIASTVTKPVMRTAFNSEGLPLKSKTPAQLAREKAAKKLKEIRKQEKEKKQQKGKKTS